MQQQFRLDRDRYLAFAFAGADLLIEIDADGKILAAIGAAQSLVGRTSAEMVGCMLDEFAASDDRALVRKLRRKLLAAGRLDPAAIHLDHREGGRTLVTLGGCAVPSLPGRAFLTVTLVPPGLTVVARARDQGTGLLSKEALLDIAKQASVEPHMASSPQLTLVSLDGLSVAASSLPPARASLLMEEIGASLRAHSISGDGAGRVAPDEFGIVSSHPNDPTQQKLLVEELKTAISAAGIDEKRVGPRLVGLDLSAGEMTESQVAKSLAYAVTSFSRSHGKSFALGSLKAGLDIAVAETAARYSAVRQLIVTEKFNLVYQPVVALDTRHVHHYEALARFPGGQSPFDIITFSEEVDLVQELDLAICQRAIKMIETTGAAIAINLSGRSVQSEAFRQKLSETVRKLTHLSQRLLFELTESSTVDNLEDAAAFLRWLRKLGFQVCLDDFGAGAAAYSYLRRFDVDFVKIDGPFLKAAKQEKRERALIRSVCRLCEELGCSVIGEMIEDDEMATISQQLGVNYGQGWLFGRPADSIPAPMIGRRKGTRESWE
jgi:EAL domain-containing protein (putative c-di-GMP-specific phosphodiesterase class I)